MVGVDAEAILRYVVMEEPDEREEEIILSERKEQVYLEDLLREHEAKKAEISSIVEDSQASEVFDEWLHEVEEEDKRVGVVYYEPKPEDEKYSNKNNLYVLEDEESGSDYLFVPHGVQVNRVDQDSLGPNVLGRTWLGTGVIEILDTLYGASFEEVLQHEINHLLYPGENERDIRERTRRQLTNPKYH